MWTGDRIHLKDEFQTQVHLSPCLLPSQQTPNKTRWLILGETNKVCPSSCLHGCGIILKRTGWKAKSIQDSLTLPDQRPSKMYLNTLYVSHWSGYKRLGSFQLISMATQLISPISGADEQIQSGPFFLIWQWNHVWMGNFRDRFGAPIGEGIWEQSVAKFPHRTMLYQMDGFTPAKLIRTPEIGNYHQITYIFTANLAHFWPEQFIKPGHVSSWSNGWDLEARIILACFPNENIPICWLRM